MARPAKRPFKSYKQILGETQLDNAASDKQSQRQGRLDMQYFVVVLVALLGFSSHL